MATTTRGLKEPCRSEINISLSTDSPVCKYLIIKMHGADLSVIGGSCTAATMLTSAAAWEDEFDCRSNSHPLKAAFRGSRPKQRKQIALNFCPFPPTALHPF